MSQLKYQLNTVRFREFTHSRPNDKSVTLGGAALFLIFGVIYTYEAFGRERGTEIEMAITGDT